MGAAGLRPGSLASGEGWRRRCGLRPAGVWSRVAGVGGRAPGLSPARRWPGRLTPGRRVRVDRLRETGSEPGEGRRVRPEGLGRWGGLGGLYT